MSGHTPVETFKTMANPTDSRRSALLRPVVLVPALVLLLVAAALASRLRGPALPGYRIEPGPLVQMVVATGRVISTSRVQVGSEVTGTVLERRVRKAMW